MQNPRLKRTLLLKRRMQDLKTLRILNEEAETKNILKTEKVVVVLEGIFLLALRMKKEIFHKAQVLWMF